jgi:hypothetical protein
MPSRCPPFGLGTCSPVYAGSPESEPGRPSASRGGRRHCGRNASKRRLCSRHGWKQETVLATIFRSTAQSRHSRCAHLGVGDALGPAARNLQALADVPDRRQVQIRARKPFAGRSEQLSKCPWLLTARDLPFPLGTRVGRQDLQARRKRVCLIRSGCCAARRSTRPRSSSPRPSAYQPHRFRRLPPADARRASAAPRTTLRRPRVSRWVSAAP